MFYTALPSMRQIVEGLSDHYCTIVEEKMAGAKIDSKAMRLYIESIRQPFYYFTRLLSVDVADQPLTLQILQDPKSE